MPRLPVILLPATRPVEGLIGDVDALPIGAQSLGACRAEAIAAAGLHRSTADAVPAGAPCVVLRSDAVVTAASLRALVATPGDDDRRLSYGGALEALCARVRLGDEAPAVALLRGAGGDLLQRMVGARPVAVDAGGRVARFPLAPGQFEDEQIELPITDHLAEPLTHWLQLLWWNLVRLPPVLLRALSSINPLVALPRLAGAAWRAGSLRPSCVLPQVRRVDAGARVHPSAVVEASWLGPGVVVGAGAIVRGCVLGAGAQVEEHGLVEGSVLAPGARVQRKAMVKFSVVREGAMAGGYMQLGVLDQRAAFKLTAALMDQSFGAPVQVRVAGRSVVAPFGLAGVCLGADAVVGAGVMVAPGRIIPPGLHIMPSPATVLRRVPAGLVGRVSVEDGGLVPARSGGAP